MSGPRGDFERAGAFLLTAFVTVAAAARAAAPPSIVLLTLDTTRADHLGCYGKAGARTPVLDGLAERGTRFARALTPSPLTLPAHTSLLTGLDPPEHGVRDNGTAALAGGVPTLAAVLAAEGYATAAVVASRVLDRRFGLARGFDRYDDRMAAEQVGEYGYPERDAAAVTDAALALLGELPPSKPYFLWVHYYDPHAPYQPPEAGAGRDPHALYAAEIAFMDRQIGRLLAALPVGPKAPIVAAVGDHGESLGEHGERAHGIFLYRAALEVPLLLAGPGIARGRVVEGTVPTRALAPTLLRLAGVDGRLASAATLTGVFQPAGEGGESEPEPIYSETRLPASAYGWSPLKALSDDRWRLIVAPRPELYDFVADPGEARNLIAEQRTEARRLRDALRAWESRLEEHAAAPAQRDPELAAALESLGYLSGHSGRDGTLDPKDGIAMLAEFDDAKRLVQTGRLDEAVARLGSLAQRNPENVPFLTHLAGALLASGQHDAALATYRRAVELNPGLDFLHLQLAHALAELGRRDEARREYELVVEINPRFSAAWLALAEMAHRAGADAEELRLLRAAASAGTASASLLLRLGQVEMAAGNAAIAAAHLREATELLPGFALAWLVRGQLALERGDKVEARQALERASELAPATAVGRNARQLLERL